jgi:hypothetical protein
MPDPTFRWVCRGAGLEAIGALVALTEVGSDHTNIMHLFVESSL